VMQAAFGRLGQGLWMRPYVVIPARVGANKHEGGMIECMVGTRSMDEVGKAGFPSLFHLFRSRFGRTDSPAHARARENFRRSLAAYAVFTYVMWVKDRHNGNIMVDDDGHLIHIDFGFLLGISPGGNLGFETAAFKLTREMVNILGGQPHSPAFLEFAELASRAFLQARDTRHVTEALVASVADSGLPCFHFADTLQNLRARHVPALDPLRAAHFFRSRIEDARTTPTTTLYDGVQKLQNGIFSEAWQ
jgi:phosphatidylinositol 4-kinase